jgi:ribosome recycling factor
MAYDKAELERRMKGAVETLKHDLASLRTGRANAGMLDPVQVEVYGANMPLNQVANVTVPEPRMITVSVWDRANVQAVEKAIRASGLGLNPNTEGQTIRLPIPEMTQDRRKDLAKTCSQYGEKARVAVRNVRRDGMEELKKAEKAKQMSEDEHKREAEVVQKMTDKIIIDVDALAAAKEKEILAG